MNDVLRLMDVVLPGHGTVPLHVSRTCIKPWTPGGAILYTVHSSFFVSAFFPLFGRRTGW